MTDLLHMMHHKDTIRVKLLRLQDKDFSVSLVFDNLLTVNCRSILGIFLINVLATSCTKYKNILGEKDISAISNLLLQVIA